jgi:S-adenosylmethionine hydrolase
MTPAAIKALALFTDFGLSDSYQGEMKAQICAYLSGRSLFDLMSGAPSLNARASAYLLAAIVRYLPGGIFIIAVVDPGVGSERKVLLLDTGRHLLLGPDNGLLSQVYRQQGGEIFEIGWRPEWLSNSFHGRDLFAPAAVRWLSGDTLSLSPSCSSSLIGMEWPVDVPQIIHVDGFGNLVSGVRFPGEGAQVSVAGKRLPYVRTFSEAPIGELIWYQNSIGLVEIAANQASAAALLQLGVGAPLEIL